MEKLRTRRRTRAKTPEASASAEAMLAPLRVETVESVISTPVVRFGLASLMLVNAIVALLDPESFQVLVTDNIVGEALPTPLVRATVMLVATNDLALGTALAIGWRPQIVLRWMAVWFFAISSLKLLSFL